MADGTDTDQDQTRSRSELDVSTLIVAAVASVVAAVLTSKLWASGTLVSTAMTPVIVALVKEYLQRPVRKIGSVAKAPLVAVKDVTPLGTQVRERATVPPEAERRGRVIEADRPDPDEYERLETLVPPGEEGVTETPYRVYRKRPRGRRWWAVGLVTGLVAFVVAAAVITIPELVGGSSVAGSGRTTLFSTHSGRTKDSSDASKDKDADQSTTPSDQKTTSTPDSSSSDRTSSSSSDSSSSSSGSSSSSSGSTTTTPQTTAPTTTTPDATGGATPTTTAPESAAPPASSSGGG